jgi:hypothetical protein
MRLEYFVVIENLTETWNILPAPVPNSARGQSCKPAAQASDVKGVDIAILSTGAGQVTWDVGVSRMRTMRRCYCASQASFNTRLTNIKTCCLVDGMS